MKKYPIKSSNLTKTILRPCKIHVSILIAASWIYQSSMLHYQKMFPYIKRCLIKEYQKYTTHRIGLFFSILQLYLLIFQIPKLLALVWPYLLQNYSVTTIIIVGAFVANLTTLLVYNLVFMVIYKIKHPFFEQYRVWDKPWPWEDNYKQWRKLLRKTLIQMAMNSFLWGPIFVLSIIFFFKIKFEYETQKIPNGWTILWQFAYFVIFQDFGTYISHSTLHHPKLYWIHKRHHQYTMTISITTIYAHPIQFIYSNILPSVVGMALLMSIYPVHFCTVLIWIVVRLCDVHDAHCGYGFSWRLGRLFPFCNDDDYHNYHHSHNVGNMEANWAIWDKLMGTDYGYEEYQRKKALKKRQKQAQKLKDK